MTRTDRTLIHDVRAGALAERLTVHRPPPLRRAVLGDLAGCHGAGLAARRTLRRQ
ncbi:hypothetical protein ACFO1B_38280 [Dactylosporangium siamense]|uniref:Uncharacterized protein n=1 Tax=Dactylosporangium siamense TaxID=685454 RepID=A0A919PW95_9ACTN|nr:hypothetical protein [Dactylosporangium siamense]GIG49623.1 hypothetical protein Dsi01nite_076640 [Dactylosporangium siamense]